MDYYSPKEIYQFEQEIFSNIISQKELMSLVVIAAVDFICSELSSKSNVIIYTGKGHNGADGYLLASQLQIKGYLVKVVELFSVEDLVPTAKEIRASLPPEVSLVAIDEEVVFPSDALIVDAILGIGAKGELSSNIKTAVKMINRADSTILALDLPSGIDPATGCSLGCYVKADYTITFLYNKISLVIGDGRDAAGKIILRKLLPDLPQKNARLLSYSSGYIDPFFKRRLKNTHKGCYQNILIVAGGNGYLGALLLTIRTCIKMGAGIIRVITEEQHIVPVLELYPNVIIISNTNELAHSYIDEADVCLVGPGLSDEIWVEEFLSLLLRTDKKLVLDAGAIRLLPKFTITNNKIIITPHPGEAAGILNKTSKQVQDNRLFALEEICEIYPVTCVLKGSGTLIKGKDSHSVVCNFGNAGLATSGTGDVLAAIVASMFRNDFDILEAATVAVYLHAIAADNIAKHDGEIGLDPMGLIDEVNAIINKKALK